MKRSAVVVAVHWSCFGPFHLARLNSAFDALRGLGIEVVGLEVTSHKNLWTWEQDESVVKFKRFLAWPGWTFEDLSPLKKWQGMLSILNKVKPDIVAINGYSDFDALAALIWCKIHGRRSIIMSDTTKEWVPRYKYKELLKRLILRQFDSALCAGIHSRSYLENLGMRGDVIFEGLDVIDNNYFWCRAQQARINRDAYDAMPGLRSKQPFFLVSSRLSKEKNIDGLIQVYSQYREVMTKDGSSPWRLVILGDGPERSRLEQVTQFEKIEGITFAGFRQINEIPIYYGLAGFFIHPTLKDTWGLVVNEAMAAGLPVLVSKRAGCAADLIEDGISGFTFSPEDIDTLRRLMTDISSGRINLCAMAKAARKRVSNWDLSRFAEGIYRAVHAAMQ